MSNQAIQSMHSFKARFQTVLQEFGARCPFPQLPEVIEREVHNLTLRNRHDFDCKVARLVSPLTYNQEIHPSFRDSAQRLYNLVVETRFSPEKSDPLPEVIANFDQVSDELYRGSQPTVEGREWLANQRGIRAFISLRDELTPPELRSWPHIRYHHIPITDGGTGDFEAVETFIALVDQTENQPSFVHCMAGIGRTGIMAACWQISRGVPTEDALDHSLRFGKERGWLNEKQRTFIRQFGAIAASRSKFSGL